MVEFAGRRIMVTGGAGFLGSRVQSHLRAAGAKDLIVPRSADADLTRESVTADLFEATRPNVVIHLAADVGGIGANRVNPGRFFYSNMAMGLNVVEQCRIHEVEKLVVIGTVCAYPKFTEVPFKEADLWDGYPEETNAAYGVAKRALLVMLQAYRQQYGLNGVYLLPVNLYGPGDNFDPETSHVIPALIRKFVDARESEAPSVDVWGTGAASREFLYVDDAARAIIAATQTYEDPEPVNVGTGREVTIRELAEMIAGLTNYAGEIAWDSTKPDGQPRRALDTTRARERFGFEAEVGLEEGLARTVDWWVENGAR